MSSTFDKTNFLILSFEAHKPPVFKEEKNKDWVLYGYDKKDRTWNNLYPDYLVSLYNKSSKHNAIINGKCKYITGRGWSVVKSTTTKDTALANAFILDAGEESLKELTKKISLDNELFGGYAMEVIMSKNGKKIASLSHIDFGKLRQDKEDETKYYFTSDWTAKKPQDNEDFTTFFLFDSDDPKDNSIIYYKTYRPDLKEYPLPPYIGGIPYIESDTEIANFTLNNTKNGFSAGVILNFPNGKPDDDGMAWVQKQINEKFTGSDRAGAIMINFSDGKDKSVEVIPIAPNGQDDRFKELNEQVGKEIFTAHEATNPVIFGVKAENGLSNNADEMRTASEYLQNFYVQPKQSIFEDIFNIVLMFNGVNATIKIIDLEPISQPLSESVLVSVLTTDEIREKGGYPPLEQKDEFCSHDHKEEFSMDMLVKFATTGYSDDELEVIDEYFCEYNPFEFQEVGNIDSQIMDILTEQPNATFEEIGQQVGKTAAEVESRVKQLIKEGLLSKTRSGIKPTAEGKTEVEELITVYKYVKRPDVSGGKIIPGSRDFCRGLIAINRNYTRDQINLLNNDFSTDVWRTRGGWFNNNGVIEPFCRHIWQSRTVKVK